MMSLDSTLLLKSNQTMNPDTRQVDARRASVRIIGIVIGMVNFRDVASNQIMHQPTGNESMTMQLTVYYWSS